MNEELLSGVLVVDKPSGWTSHDVVNKVRRIASTKKVGHLGTLDPLCTGVLPLVLGKATRLAQFHKADTKAYEAEFQFGIETNTYDTDGDVLRRVDGISIGRDELQSALSEFRGRFAQVPPAVSAKKIQGRPAYELARKNIAVELPPVEVEVMALDVLDAGPDWARVAVRCAAGTYVRSIAHDLGQRLGVGGVVRALRRTESGEFRAAQSRSLEELQELSSSGRLLEAIIPPAQMLPNIPVALVDELTTVYIRQGRTFNVNPFRVPEGTPQVKAVSPDGELVAIGEIRMPHVYQPVVVL